MTTGIVEVREVSIGGLMTFDQERSSFSFWRDMIAQDGLSQEVPFKGDKACASLVSLAPLPECAVNEIPA